MLQHLRQWRSFAKEALEQTAIVAKFLCALHITDTYLCTPLLVLGPSMLPTLNITGDIVLAERVSPRLGNFSIGDVVVVHSPDNPRRIITKRIVGLEGDTVTFVVNPVHDPDWSRTVVVPKGHVWIQGDNIYASNDSRHFGPLPCGLIKGRVFCRVWPVNGFGSLKQRA